MEFDNTQDSGEQSVEGQTNSESPTPAEAPQSTGQQEAAPAVQKEPPFHEHPRFRELIEQNRSYKSAFDQQAQQLQMLQTQLQQLQQMQKPQQETIKPHSKVFERLQGIDPEFAGLQSELYEKTQTLEALQKDLEELRGWKQQRDMEAVTSKVDTTLKGLYDQNKVSEADKPFYEALINKYAADNPKATINDVPALFKQAHESFTKYVQDRDRKLRESYVTEKTKDKTPAPTTGGTPPSPNKPAKGFASMEEKIQHMKGLVVDELRRSKEKV